MLSGSLAPEAFYVPINLFVLCMTSQTDVYNNVLYSVQNICGMNVKHRGQTVNECSRSAQDSYFHRKRSKLRTGGDLMFSLP
jgi:hypothetical protein